MEKLATTIRISVKLKNELESRKLYRRETYEEVIWRIINDNRKLKEQYDELLERSYGSEEYISRY